MAKKTYAQAHKKARAAESMAKSRELSQAGKAEKIPDTTKPGDPDHEGLPKASSEPKASFMDMIKAGGKVPEGQTQTDKGGTVSKEGLAKFQKAKEAKATELNKYSLFEHMQGRDRAPNQVSPTSLPHLRRAMQAGLVKVEGKELVLTDEGREAQEAHEAKREHDLKRAEERHGRMGDRAKLKGAPPKGPAADLPPPGAGGEQAATQEGPRGGRYYVNAAGEKVYVK